MPGRVPEVDEPLGDDRVDDAEEEVGVRARPDEEVLVGFLGRLRPARVHHDEAPAAFADRPQPARNVRHGHEAAVRRERVRTEDEDVVGAVQVGHGHGERATEHEPGAHLLRHLVDRAGAEHVRRPEALQQDPTLDDRPEVVRIRIAEVHGHRVAVLLEDRTEPALDLRERLVPRRVVPRVAAPDLRPADPVGVRFELLERGALGTEVAVAEHVLFVTPHQGELVVVEVQLQAAGRLAEWTGPVRDALRHGARLRPRRTGAHGRHR